ncbi:MAG: Maf family protein [Acidobacteria bacterium]|nr:Maf family protein [Acidobacteriota bacterium]
MARGKEPDWILASASPRRNEILRQLGLRFKVDPCRAPEPPQNVSESPSCYVRRVSRFKAAAVSKLHPDSRIIAADTIVVVNDAIIGKPSGRAEAKDMLRRLGGRRHEVLTGLCLATVGEQRRVYSSVTCSGVYFCRMSGSDIDWYLNTEEYRDKAGAYGIQGFASLFIDRVEGCYFNIVGFPVSGFARLCRRAKINLLENLPADF